MTTAMFSSGSFLFSNERLSDEQIVRPGDFGVDDGSRFYYRSGADPMLTRQQSDDAITLRVDGSKPLTASLVDDLQRLCDTAEDRHEIGVATLEVSGVPNESWSQRLTIGLVAKWERALRRFERLSMGTVAVASADFGGPALDAFMAADFRFMTSEARLFMSLEHGATWPGMALYRFTSQLGVGRARRVALLGSLFDSETAHDFDLIAGSSMMVPKPCTL